MPLHESFQRRSKTNLVKLSKIPSLEDLQYRLQTARQTPRHGVSLAWLVNGDVRVLTIICGTDPSTDDAVWTLRTGESHTSPLLWKHLTSDPELIHSVINQEAGVQPTAAVIPDFLRPASAPVPMQERYEQSQTGSSQYQQYQQYQHSQDAYRQSQAGLPLQPPTMQPPTMQPPTMPQYQSGWNVQPGFESGSNPFPQVGASQQQSGGMMQPNLAPAPAAPPAAPQPKPDLSAELPGTVFADRYEIIEEIGKGAMGVVYKAKQRIMDRFVAVKVLHPQLLMQDVNKQRFENEARATSALSHPNLIHIYDCGTSANGQPFIVMDYLDGPSLEDLLQHSQILEHGEVVDIFSQICRGLSHAHRRGVIHRDLKPSNVILTEGDKNSIEVKILDFGIAKAVRASGAKEQNLTQFGDVVGSPLYMSPEQCKGDELDGRTDIYALGCMMYQALTGKFPFIGKDPMETMFKHVYEQPTPFEKARPDLPIAPELKRIILKCLATDMEDRYESADDLETDLLRFGFNRTVIPTPIAAAPVPVAAVESAPEAVAEVPPPAAAAVPEHAPAMFAQTAARTSAQEQTPSMWPAPVFEEPAAAAVLHQAPPSVAPPQPAAEPPAESESLILPSAQPALAPPSLPIPAAAPAMTSAPQVSAPAVRASNGLTAMDLLVTAGIITKQDFEHAVQLTEEVGGDAGNILLGAGKVKPSILGAARKCLGLIDRGTCNLSEAVILVSYCNRGGMSFDEGLAKLGWKLPD